MSEKVELILWKPLIETTIVLYLLVLLLAVVWQPAAMVLMFAIVCLWSRVPCMLSNFTKDMDVIDFFVVFLAINIGGVFAGIFGMSIMLFSRLFGPGEMITYTIKDSIAFLIGGMITPFLYILGFKNILITMYLFTIVGRYGVYVLQDFLFDQGAIFTDITYIAVGIPFAYFSNTILIKIFGNSLNNLFETGLQFSFGLFFLITAFVVGFYLFGKMLRHAEEEISEKTGATIRELFHSPEPHEVIISYFDVIHIPWILEGSFKAFRIKLFLMTTSLLIVTFFIKDYVPKWYELITMIVVLYIVIHLLIIFIEKITGKELPEFSRKKHPNNYSKV
jgi:hypothetical protein